MLRFRPRSSACPFVSKTGSGGRRGHRRRDRGRGSRSPFPLVNVNPISTNRIAISFLQLGPNSANSKFRIGTPYRNINSPIGAPISMTGSLELAGDYQLWGQLY